MDLTKEINSVSSTPHRVNEGIICLNIDSCNLVHNMGTVSATKIKWIGSIGVWKIKQLK